MIETVAAGDVRAVRRGRSVRKRPFGHSITAGLPHGGDPYASGQRCRGDLYKADDDEAGCQQRGVSASRSSWLVMAGRRVRMSRR
jgi:hypothetical protein